MSSIDDNRIFSVFLGAWSLLVLGLLSGCAQLDLPDKLSWSDKPPKPRVPILMTDTWTDTIRYTQGKSPQRGFGGRIMFCDKEGGKPVAVDGKLTVYAFDEAHKDMKHLAPLRKFVFPAATLSKHYSKSQMGHSYSFWLPWDKVGGPEQRLALIAKFEATKGGAITSRESYHLLPGMPGEGPRQPVAKSGSQQGQEVRQVSYESAVEGMKERPRLGPTTFNLSPSLTRKLAASPQSQAFGGPITVADQSGRNSSPAYPPQVGPAPGQQPNGTFVAPPATNYHPSWEDRSRRDYGSEPSRAAAPSTRFSRSRFPAQTSTTFRPGSFPAPSRQYQSGWPSSPPASPQSNWPDQLPAPASVAGPPSSLASAMIAD